MLQSIKNILSKLSRLKSLHNAIIKLPSILQQLLFEKVLLLSLGEILYNRLLIYFFAEIARWYQTINYFKVHECLTHVQFHAQYFASQ